jgi:hypothetical protein
MIFLLPVVRGIADTNLSTGTSFISKNLYLNVGLNAPGRSKRRNDALAHN